VPPRVEYALTAPAQKLLPILSALAVWLHDNESELSKGDSASRQALARATDSD
jgi:DNA-binding HxlR family transcriptional regulator